MGGDDLTLLIVDFPARPPGGPEQAAQMRALAASIAGEAGLLWKLWTESTEEKRAGGVYLFETRATAEAYLAMHSERLAGFGISGIEARFRSLNGALSHMTRGPIPG